MSVTAVKHYEFEPLDKQENFHGNIITYWYWQDHLIFCSAIALPFSPAMPFGDVVKNVLPGAYGYHPDFAKIDWSKVEWMLDGSSFAPQMDKSLAENGLHHKSLVRFVTPGLNGINGTSN